MSRILILLLLAVVATAAPVPKSLKKSATLDGQWEMVTMTRGGADVSKSNPTVWDIRGDTVSRSYREPDGTLRQDSSTASMGRPDPSNPSEVDYTLNTGGRLSLFRARLKLTGDELVVRFAEPDAPRPPDLNDGPDGWLYVLRRVRER